MYLLLVRISTFLDVSVSAPTAVHLLLDSISVGCAQRQQFHSMD